MNAITVHKVLTTATAITAVIVLCAAVTWPDEPSKSPIVLEAINKIYGVWQGPHTTLLVRVRKDGTVDWEDRSGSGQIKLRTENLSSADLSAIEHRLASIDHRLFEKTMGPYATYVDTEVSLDLVLTSGQQSEAFTLINPWKSKSRGHVLGSEKEMPEDVRTIICEVSRLRNRLSNDPIDEACGTPN